MTYFDAVQKDGTVLKDSTTEIETVHEYDNKLA